MSRGQRIAMVAVAAVIAIAAVLVLRTGDEEDDSPAPARTTVTTGATALKPKPRAKPTLLTANSGRTIRVKKGEVARFRVRHGTAEEVHVHGYDIVRALPAGRTITVRVPAKLEGVYEIELERSHTPLGELEVRP